MAAREPPGPPVLLRLALVLGELVESLHALPLERSPALQEPLGAEQQADGPLAKLRVKLPQERLELSCVAELQRAVAHLEAPLLGRQQAERRAWVACQPAPQDVGLEWVPAP